MILPDRLEAGCYAIGAVITGGEVTLQRRARAGHAATDREAARSRSRGLASGERHARPTRQQLAGGRDPDAALPGLPDRPAGAVRGADDTGRRALPHPRARVRRSPALHRRIAQDGRGYSRREVRADIATARKRISLAPHHLRAPTYERSTFEPGRAWYWPGLSPTVGQPFQTYTTSIAGTKVSYRNSARSERRSPRLDTVHRKAALNDGRGIGNGFGRFRRH